MAYRRQKSYRRFFRSKRKSVSWTKETVQLVSSFAANDTGSFANSNFLPAFCVSKCIVQNTGSGGFQATNSLALRTVKNFVVNGAFTYAVKAYAPSSRIAV